MSSLRIFWKKTVRFSSVEDSLSLMGNLAQSSDSDLLFSFCQKREERAFTLLAQRHHEMMYRTAFRILANEEDTRDVLQAALIVFSKRVSELGTRRPLGNWLLRVVIMESCLLYTSPSPRDQRGSRMPSSA